MSFDAETLRIGYMAMATIAICAVWWLAVDRPPIWFIVTIALAVYLAREVFSKI